MKIRLYEEKDWHEVWQILHPIFCAGETYCYSPQISEQEAKAQWLDKPLATFVYEIDGQIVGSYYLKENQPALGAHVANCGYAVGENCRGRGVASQMCRHSVREASRRGFLAMQFNLVVSTNEVAVRLWQKHGFDIVGTLPKAFRHARLGLVDAYVMFRQLAE